MSTTPDLCIIGAGSLGIDLALHAHRLGAEVVLVDRGVPEPGDAAHMALRKTAFAESARRAQDMRRAPDLGVGASQFKLSLKQISERADQLVEDRGRAVSPEILKARGVTIMRGETRFLDARSLMIGDDMIKPRAVIVAIGAAPIVPDLPGLGDAGFFTPDTIFENQRKLTHLVIIGSDATAFEQAQIQRRLGAEVTLVPQGPILPAFDPEAVALLSRALRDEGIVIREGASVASVKHRSQGIGVEILSEAGAQDSLDASHLLVSMGRQADLDALDVVKARPKGGKGIAPGLGNLPSSRFLRFAGQAAGHAEWSEAVTEGRATAEAALGRRNPSTLRAPRLVLTEPALAEISTEIPAKQSAGATILRENFAENDRAAAMGQGAGLVKVTVGAEGQVLRATAVGPEAAELIGVLSLVGDRRSGLADLARLPLPRPSLFEVLSRLGENYLAAQDVSKRGQGSGVVRRLFRR